MPTGKPAFAEGRGTPGDVTLLVDGREVGSGKLPVTAPIRLAQGGAMQVGRDSGAAATPEYKPPFTFTGTIRRVIVDTSGDHVVDHEAEMRMALVRQ